MKPIEENFLALRAESLLFVRADMRTVHGGRAVGRRVFSEIKLVYGYSDRRFRRGDSGFDEEDGHEKEKERWEEGCLVKLS